MEETMADATAQAHATDLKDKDIVDWADLGEEMWSYLTGRGAAINYNFVDMAIEIPRDTGPEAPRATWKLNGTLRITTSDQQTTSAGQAQR